MQLSEKEKKLIELYRKADFESIAHGQIIIDIQDDIPVYAKRVEGFKPDKEEVSLG